MTRYTSLPQDDSNLDVTLTESPDLVTVDINPAYYTLQGAGEVTSVNGLSGAVTLTTNEIPENTNLYYTQARVDNHLADGTITDIKTSQLTLTGGTGTQGQVTWNGDEETLDVITNGSVLQLGQEVVYHVRNNTGSPIADGTPVYVTGTVGASGRLTIAPFIANNTIPAQFFIGLTTETIEAGGDGKVTHFGKVRGINTSAYPEGSVLYVSPTVAGGLTTVEPEAPNLKLPVVFVVNSANNGTLFIRATTGIDLHSNHRVQVANLADNDLFVWDNAQTRWENRTIASLDLATQTWVNSQNYLTSYTETDPLFQASPAGTITNANIINWNTAWGWGNHALAGYLTSYTETDPVFTASPAGSITTLQKTNWDTAYSWGNHATQGYLTSFTETDPVFTASPAGSITTLQKTNWDTAYSWGNHATQGYLTSFTETDPVFTASPAGSITAPDITNWNTAYSWGNHATQGYLTSYTETDPVFLASPSAGILAGDITNWNTAYGWGDHSTAGYLSSVALNDVTDVVITTPTVDQVLKYDGANWVNSTVSTGGLGNVVEDTTPQLGGTLDLNTNAIVDGASADLLRYSGNNLELKAQFNGSGTNDMLILRNYGALAGAVRLGVAQSVGAGFAGFVSWQTNNGNRLQDIKAINDGADSGNHDLQYWMYAGSNTNRVDIIAADKTVSGRVPMIFDASEVTITGNKYPNTTGTTGQVLTTDGAGTLTWTTVSGGGGASALGDLTDVTITTPSDGDILRYNGIATEWQNTNLGLSLTPLLSVEPTYNSNVPAIVTITNYGDYEDANIWAQVKDSLGNVVVPNSQITDNYDGTFTFTGPAPGTGYQLEVKVQDFGDLASDTATATFDTEAFGGTYRYWRIQDFTGNPNNMGIYNLRYYSGPGQTGTAYPPNMTSENTPAPYVVTASFSRTEVNWKPWNAFDANLTGTWWWTLGAGDPIDDWLQIDFGADVNIASLRVGPFYSGIPTSMKIYASTTGAFAGEEVLITTIYSSPQDVPGGSGTVYNVG